MEQESVTGCALPPERGVVGLLCIMLVTVLTVGVSSSILRKCKRVGGSCLPRVGGLRRCGQALLREVGDQGSGTTLSTRGVSTTTKGLVSALRRLGRSVTQGTSGRGCRTNGLGTGSSLGTIPRMFLSIAKKGKGALELSLSAFGRSTLSLVGGSTRERLMNACLGARDPNAKVS